MFNAEKPPYERKTPVKYIPPGSVTTAHVTPQYSDTSVLFTPQLYNFFSALMTHIPAAKAGANTTRSPTQGESIYVMLCI